MRMTTAGALAFVPALLSLPAHAQQPDYGGFRQWHATMHGDWGWGGMFGGMFMMVLFWGGLALVIFLAIRWLGTDRGGSIVSRTTQRSPLDILKERYARGEIDKAEYEERRRVISE
jgi:putative membrane protein